MKLPFLYFGQFHLLKETIKAIEKENMIIEKKVEEIIKIKNEFVDFNKSLIQQMKAY